MNLESIKKSLLDMCAQALMVLVVSVITIAYCLLEGKMVLALILTVNAILSVMVLNCLCKANCSNLAWFYAIISSISILATGKVIFNGKDYIWE